MDPYRVLNVDSQCSDEQLKAAYRKLLQEYTAALADDPSAQAKIDELYSSDD